MMRIPGFDLKYTEEDIRWIRDEFEKILRTGFISIGNHVKQFEDEFAAFSGVPYALATANGTCSIEMILRAIGVQGFTVIVPSHTFMATAVAVIHAGGKVIFTDCQRENFQMDPQDLLRKIRPDTKAVILVHMSGIISPHFDEIKRICDQHHLYLIEDAAHAHGATIDGRKAGSLGVAASFSFFSTKVLTTGEGGMITTADKKILDTCKALRDHGRFGAEPNIHDEFGYNWRPSEFHTVLGLCQLQKVDQILEERRWIARLYDEKIAERKIPKIKLLKIPPKIKSAYYKYILYCEDSIDREELKKRMREDYGVSLPGELFNQACHSQPVFKKYPETVVMDQKDQFPETQYVVRKHFCLPLYLGLKEEQIDYIVDSLEKTLRSMA
jgi:dTDP-4-amino-4,6-dideoxygalactose transaminase